MTTMPGKHTAGLDLQAMIELPYGKAAHIIRQKVDSRWGMPLPEDGGVGRYKMRVHTTETFIRVYEVEVDAEDETHAEELAEEMYDSGECRLVSEDFEDVDIDDVTIVSGPENA